MDMLPVVMDFRGEVGESANGKKRSITGRKNRCSVYAISPADNEDGTGTTVQHTNIFQILIDLYKTRVFLKSNR